MDGGDHTIERRFLEVRANGRMIEGYAAVFGVVSNDLGGFVETIRPGAFTDALRRARDVVAVVEHEKSARSILGRVSAGTLTLAEDQTGLRFSVSVADTQVGRDILESVGRGDVTGASFAFRVGQDDWDRSQTPIRREILKVQELLDVSITANPAYSQATVSRRSLDAIAAAERRLRVIELMGATHGSA